MTDLSSKDEPPSSESSIRPKSARNRRVLIVDDNEVVRTILDRVLRTFGHDVVCAASGEEAEAIYVPLRSVVDLVLLDMCMPGMDGLETFQALRRIDPAVKVVLMSGAADPTRVRQTLDAGALAFLEKPIDPERMCKLIQELTANHSEAPPSPRPGLKRNAST